MADDRPIRILMICMGNICRSPLAEGVFRALMHEREVADRFELDSCGTGGWHAGEPADPRMREVADRHGVALESRARQIRAEDLEYFDYLVCMDEDNRQHVLNLGAPAARVSLLLEHHPASTLAEVPDPYYGGEDGFEFVYRLVEPACRALLEQALARG
jgi:protein-tyrosine phosphatase